MAIDNMNRREFLKSAFAASSLAVLPAFPTSEYDRCRNDIVYFTNKYLLGNRFNCKLNEWQEKYLKHLSDGKSAILNGCRRCGKTVLAADYHIWKKVFYNENVRIVTLDAYAADMLCKTIVDRICLLPKEFKTDLDMSYLHRSYVSCEDIFNKVGIKGKAGCDFEDCKSIVFDDFAFFKNQVESLNKLLRCLEIHGNNDVQVVYASTPPRPYGAFNFMCDAFINEDEGAYFEVNNDGVKII